MSVLEFLVKIDIAVMRVLGGKPRETISSAAWNAHINYGLCGWTHWLIDALFFPFQRDHCRKDWEFRREIYRGGN